VVTLKDLESSVEFYQGQVQSAHALLERAKGQLEAAERDWKVATSFLELERRRLNQDETTPLRRQTLRDAASAVVTERGRATIAEIIETLDQRGYVFDKPSRGRAVHAALIKAAGIRKIGSKTYEVEAGRLI
jgi:DNA phosphorothioation-dependent restriction protein DptG